LNSGASHHDVLDFGLAEETAIFQQAIFIGNKDNARRKNGGFGAGISMSLLSSWPEAASRRCACRYGD
jgi:hypothetical protein